MCGRCTPPNCARIDVQRARFALQGYTYTDPTLGAWTAILAQHITELRAALVEMYVRAGATPPSYVDQQLTTGTMIKAVHMRQLRAAFTGIE